MSVGTHFETKSLSKVFEAHIGEFVEESNNDKDKDKDKRVDEDKMKENELAFAFILFVDFPKLFQHQQM